MTRDRADLPDLAEAYPRYRGLLLSALGRFAARSIPVPPDQGLDLVHDFFTEEWPGIRRRFDPSRGPANAYVYSAFVRFAKARLIAAARLREVPIAAWRAAPEGPRDDSPQERILIDEEERERLQASLLSLEEPDRKLLLRFAESGTSERALARDFGLSRHAVRERLVGSIGRLVVDLVAPRVPSRDREAVVALWGDLHTAREASRLLGIPEAETKEVRQRTADQFTRYLDALRDRKSPIRSDDRGGTEMNAHDAIRGVLSAEPVGSAGYRQALDWLRERSEKVLDALESFEGALEIEGDESTRARRSNDFYAAVSEGLGGETLAAKEAETAHDPFVDEKVAMVAEVDTFLAEVPHGWRSLQLHLRGLDESDRLNDEELARFRREPDVAAWTSQAAEELAPWGIGPVSLWAARRALADVVDRSYRSGAADRGGLPISLRPDGIVQGDARIVGVDAIVPVLASRAQVSAGVAAKLYEWFCFAQDYSESVLPGIALEGGGKRRIGDGSNAEGTMTFHSLVHDREELVREIQTTERPQTEGSEGGVKAGEG